MGAVLELCKNLLERGACQGKIWDETLFLDVTKLLEHSTELDSIVSLISNRFNFVKDLIFLLSLGLPGGCLVKSQVRDTLRDTDFNLFIDYLHILSLANDHI